MHQRGFSLIELMIAITLGMLAVAAVGSVFIYGSRNYKQDDKLSRMQDELRFAMAQITQDIEMAGFYAQIRDLINDIDLHGTATVPTAERDCGPTIDSNAFTTGTNWVFRERRAAVFTRGNATPAEANATFPCITNSADEFVSGTDVLALKRVSSATNTLQIGKPYLRTNGVETTLYVATSASTASPDPAGTVCDPSTTADDTTCTVTIYEYRPVVWYIRPYSVSPGESPRIPALCRKVFRMDGGVAGMTGDDSGCIASGIANMQLEFGFDVPDGTGRYDGLADTFREIGAPLTVPLPTSSDPHPMAFVVAVRVHLLAQSTQRDVDYKPILSKTYQLAGTTVGPFDDGYYRKSLSSTVLIRNVMNRISPYSLPSY